MAAMLVPDNLWGFIEPFLQPHCPSRKVADRAYQTALALRVIFVLRTAIPWRMLPKKLDCGSGMTCWRRVRDWQQDGIWHLIQFALLNWLSRDGQIDWSLAVVDSCSVQAVLGAANWTESARSS